MQRVDSKTTATTIRTFLKDPTQQPIGLFVLFTEAIQKELGGGTVSFELEMISLLPKVESPEQQESA